MLSVDAVTRRGTDLTFDAQLRATDGCADGVMIEFFIVVWEVTFYDDPTFPVSFPQVEIYVSELPESTFTIGRELGVTSIEITRIEIYPDHREYGGELYTTRVNRRVYSVGDSSTN